MFCHSVSESHLKIAKKSSGAGGSATDVGTRRTIYHIPVFTTRLLLRAMFSLATLWVKLQFIFYSICCCSLKRAMGAMAVSFNTMGMQINRNKVFLLRMILFRIILLVGCIFLYYGSWCAF